MNTEKVQAEIQKIITDIRAKGWRMNKTTQKAWREIEELGLAEYLQPYRAGQKGDAVVNAVLEAAKDAGGKKVTDAGFYSAGDGYADTWTTEPSALYMALNETDEPPYTPIPHKDGNVPPTNLKNLSVEMLAGIELSFTDFYNIFWQVLGLLDKDTLDTTTSDWNMEITNQFEKFREAVHAELKSRHHAVWTRGIYGDIYEVVDLNDPKTYGDNS